MQTISYCIADGEGFRYHQILTCEKGNLDDILKERLIKFVEITNKNRSKFNDAPPLDINTCTIQDIKFI